MKFKVGDKVKFLNEQGGGVVSKIISASMVNVMISDGFEIPTMTGELLKVGESGAVASMFDEDFKVDIKKEEIERLQQLEPEDSRSSALGNYAFRVKNSSGVYIAFVPQDQKWLVTGEIEIYIVNHSDYDVFFNLFLKNEDALFVGADYDVIEPHSKVLLDTIDREEIESWLKGIIQLMFHTDEMDRVFKPVHAEFNIKAPRLFKETNYKESEFIEEKSLLYSVSTLTELETSGGSPAKDTSEENIKPKLQQVKHHSLISKFQTGPRMAVVDLHIEELLDNADKMSGHEILVYQVDYFIKCLESAITENYQKVTFIHGVGNGALKNALITKLKEYENTDNHSASLAKFGVGAIDVVIRPMK